jgi:NAD(P)-dependent dehydrogenase (short-subunit alcohol dehydrogenase family)
VSVLALDLSNQESVRAFATAFAATRRPLHILVNNAGANFWGARPSFTPGGVGACAQANFLGAYTLTRLLEGALLVSAPSRVVNVSSVTHRAGTLKAGAARFLREWERGTYADAKLAQVMFAYELDRRTSPRGVRAVAVDPGAVQTGIWAKTPLARPALRALMDKLYAPPHEGAAAVVYAACADLEAAEAAAVAATTDPTALAAGGAAAADAPRAAHREPCRLYFARGLFARAPVTADGWLPNVVWKGAALLASIADEPLRRVSCGSMGVATAAVRSSPESYDRLRARELWNAAADAAELPQEVG